MTNDASGGLDPFLKRCFDDPVIVEALVRDFAPPRLVGMLDFSSLERQSGELGTDDLRERFSDRIWRLRCGTGEEACWCYLYVIVEFQSRADPWMVLRIIQYMVLLWLDLAARREIRPGDLLPPILPLVWYVDEAEWNAPRSLFEMLHPITREIWKSLGDFILADAHRVSQEMLDNLADPLSHFFRLEKAASAAEAIGAVRDGLAALPGPEFAPLRRMLILWLLGGPGRRRGFARKIPHLADLQEDDPMLEERFLKSLEEYDNALRAQGFSDGHVKGFSDGHVKGFSDGHVKGFSDGHVKGHDEGQAFIVRNMLASGMTRDGIVLCTGLSAEEVDRLAESPAEDTTLQ